MRRVAKPFTVEVKKRGGRRREGGEALPTAGDVFANDLIVGRNIRFRDAEILFKSGDSLVSPAQDEKPSPPMTFERPGEGSPRRILPDLVAEAAISEEAARAVMPELRRRGRPPKVRTDEALPRPVKREQEPKPTAEVGEISAVLPRPPTAPAMLDLAASARRRAARSTDNLPRGERWKRRLPKVCW